MQAVLFDESALAIPSARVSSCGRYRWDLVRLLGPGPTLAFVMVNPSTADATHDDPTSRKCKEFARLLGFGCLVIVNLFAWRATDPLDLVAVMRQGEDVVGPENDETILDVARTAGLVIAGWGPKPWAKERAEHVLELLSSVTDVHCLRRTKDGTPEHPLFLPMSLRPELYRAKERP
jgi:hypothetical protein